MLDPTEQRIVGVLLEKELSVPDSYPLTENALLAGCNQRSNRHPEMALESFQLAGALLALRERGWVARVEGGRAARYRHQVGQRLGLDARAKAVLAELLLRGPQAPGELSRRVSRMGFEAQPAEVVEVLHALASRPEPLAEQLGMRPREREQRWRHRLGAPAEEAEAAAPEPASPPPSPAPAPAQRPAADLESRVGRVEERLERLEELVERLREGRSPG